MAVLLICVGDTPINTVSSSPSGNQENITLEHRMLALRQAIGLDSYDYVSPGQSGEHMFSTKIGEYLVLTDDEAFLIARQEAILMAWREPPELLVTYVKHDPALGGSGMIHAVNLIARKETNSAVVAMIADIATFASDMVEYHGRGHYIANKNGEQLEADLDDGTTLYIYRVN